MTHSAINKVDEFIVEELYNNDLPLLPTLHPLIEPVNEGWGFPEFIHGQKLTPGGIRHQGWSAAGVIIGHHALAGQVIFRIDSHES